MVNSNEPTWHYNAIADDDEAAMAWGVTTEQWDALPPEHQGRMLETYRAQRIKRAWEAFVNRPKK